MIVSISVRGVRAIAGPMICAVVACDGKGSESRFRSIMRWVSRDPSRLLQSDFAIQEIDSAAALWAVEQMPVCQIDLFGEHRAQKEVMRRALCRFHKKQPFKKLYVGKNQCVPDIALDIVRKDDDYVTVLTARSIAKAFHTWLMQDLHLLDSRYYWDRNAGYSTAAHLRAIGRYGIHRLHRIHQEAVMLAMPEFS